MQLPFEDVLDVSVIHRMSIVHNGHLVVDDFHHLLGVFAQVDSLHWIGVVVPAEFLQAFFMAGEDQLEEEVEDRVDLIALSSIIKRFQFNHFEMIQANLL